MRDREKEREKEREGGGERDREIPDGQVDSFFKREKQQKVYYQIVNLLPLF